MLLGVVSDTHGYLNPRVLELLQGVELILHAGDIGDVGIIDQLSNIAPVSAVRGNNDRTGPTSLYPEKETLELADGTILLTHQVKVPKTVGDPGFKTYLDESVDLVVFGHTHIALQKTLGSILFFNPGAAGKRRFKLVPSIGTLTLERGQVRGTIFQL